MRCIFAAIVCVIWVTVQIPAPVLAQVPVSPDVPPDVAARALFSEGVALASRREFVAAAVKFHAAHDRVPTPASLFAWAQAERLGGNCPRAVPLYQKFLAGTPAADHVEAAQIGLRRCAETDPASLPLPSAPVTAPVAPAVPTSTPLPASAARPMPVVRTDWLSAGVLTAGTIALGVGTTFIVLSLGEENAAQNSSVYDGYLGHMERARWQRPLGIGVGAVGVGLLALGVYRVFGPTSVERTTVVPDLQSRGLIVRRTF